MSPAWQREGASLGSFAGHRGSHGWPVAEAQPSPDQPPGPRVLGRCSLPPSAGRFAPRTQCRLLEDSPELLAQKEPGGQYQAPPAVAPAAWQPRAWKEGHRPRQSGTRISVESCTYLTEDDARRGAGRRVGPQWRGGPGRGRRTPSQSVRAAVRRPHPRAPRQDGRLSPSPEGWRPGWGVRRPIRPEASPPVPRSSRGRPSVSMP